VHVEVGVDVVGFKVGELVGREAEVVEDVAKGVGLCVGIGVEVAFFNVQL